MRIGIITIIGQGNYGNKLQNYAVDRVLKKLGAEVVTFNFLPKDSFKKRIKNVIKDILHIKDCYGRKRIGLFDEFDRKYLAKDSIVKADEYDYVVCGSDQIWNCNFKWLTPQLDIYFGAFLPPEKRVAYSASIGTDEIPTEFCEAFKKYISEMKAISVREEQARKTILQLTGREVSVTLDPTLMLSKDEWMVVAKKPSYMTDEKYILTYFLGSYTKAYRKYIYDIAAQKNLKVINLEADYKDASDIENINFFMTGPDEFIWLIANCEIITRKPFRCFPRIQNGLESMSSRMDTLFEKFGTVDWCKYSLDERVEDVVYCDYSKVDDVLKNEQQYAMDFLKSALEL